MLSMTTDYVCDTGCPEAYLRAIAEAGFSHIHWCHHWNTDFLYSRHEIDAIAQWLRAYGLQLNDLHGSAGQEKTWGSLLEYERLAGIELVKNRMEMTARLGSDVVIMHIPSEPEEPGKKGLFWRQVHRSLDELRDTARRLGVRIALENGVFETMELFLARYSHEFLGLCYDSGHGNLRNDGLDCLEKLKDRLISIHLHDNDGSSDQHKLLFSGTVNWPRLADIIARSSYAKCISLEVTMRNCGIEDETVFLKKAFEWGEVFSAMVREGRSPL